MVGPCIARRFENHAKSRRADGIDEASLDRDFAREEQKANAVSLKEMVARLHEQFPNLQLGLERIAQVYEAPQ